MTEQEAVEAIKEICKDKDAEREHLAAEEVLLRFLRENGFEELSKVYDELSQNFYYA